MPRGSGKLDAILSAIVARLIAQVSGCNAATCYLCLNPDAVPSPNPGDFVYVVAPTGGEFDDALFDGGGQNQATVNAGVIVKIHSPVQLDEARHDAQFLTHSTLGVLEKSRLVMKALADWSPADGGANEITRNPLIPANYGITHSQRQLGAVELTFHLTYDWDLS